MAEALKDIYNEAFLQQFGERVHSVYSDFDIDGFLAVVMDDKWDERKLKERIRHISVTLGKYLPAQYDEALDVLFAIDQDCVGFPYLFFPDFVEVFGQADEHWALSMKALERFTGKSSAEFAVRAFLICKPEQMMSQMEAWAQNSDEHVRRLASEGCRPRLPWGQALAMFKQDPTPVLHVLELLKADPSLYVRKSVANNLNDIAKDHPSVVLQTIRSWKGANPYTDWIARHGSRTLIRQANPEAMALFGYAESADDGPLTTSASLSVEPVVLSIGDTCELRYDLRIREGELAHIRIEYRIDFVKASGRTSAKSFLLSDKKVPGGTRLTGARTHKWSDLTTRRHYPGKHKISLMVNGNEAAHAEIELLAGEREGK